MNDTTNKVMMEISNDSAILVKYQINFLAQLSNWAKIWVSSSQIKAPLTCRAKIAPTYDDQSKDTTTLVTKYSKEILSEDQLTHLYHLTCQKLVRTKHKQTDKPSRQKLRNLGDLVNVRAFWNTLEKMVYQELSSSKNYSPPSKRVPFCPDKPGSLFMPKRSKRYVIQMIHNQPYALKRKSFASTAVIYTLEPDEALHQYTIEPNEDAEDNIPLGTLRLRKHKP